MTEVEIFKHLHTLSQQATDPRGVGAAALVKNGEIIVSATSSEDGIEHAEARVFAALPPTEQAADMTLYCTIEPCSSRTDDVLPTDDVSLIIKHSINEVVFAVASPNYAGETARQRLAEAGIASRQITNADLVAEIATTFNSSIDPANPVAETKPTTLLGLLVIVATTF